MIRYTLDKNNRGAEVSRRLYGLFFDDINQAADGGLNAEMVVNNSFEFEYLSYDAHNCTVPVQLRSMKDKFWDISGAGPHYISTDGGIAPTNPSYLLLCVGGIYRLITKKKMNEKYLGYVNAVGFFCLIALMVVVAVNDVIKLF